MTQIKERTAACRIGACQRHNDCMYTPCRSALAVAAPDARGTDPGHFTFVAVGKQVLIDGRQHYADACDPEAAEWIAAAVNLRRELIGALVEIDKAARQCPANGKRPLGDKPCPTCRATSSDSCREQDIAGAKMIAIVRAQAPAVSS